MEFIGIGDLHFDGHLIKDVPNLNSLICDEVRVVFDYARRNTVRNVFFYGDICERPAISMNAQVEFFNLLTEANDLRIWVIAGNHDFQSRKDDDARGTVSSLELFSALRKAHSLKHCRFIIDSPVDVVIDHEPVHFMPWPSRELNADALNVLHVEVNGAAWDSGRPIKGDDLLSPGDIPCVIGHIHTNQKVGNAHFSGTLYQTNFGEKPEKYFHHGRYEDGRLRLKNVRHYPFLKLHNIVIESNEDAESIPQAAGDLCKVFVRRDVVLDPDFLAKHPSIIRINPFSTTKELKRLMAEEFHLEHQSTDIDHNSYLVEWLKKRGLKSRQVKSVMQTHDRLKASLVDSK